MLSNFFYTGIYHTKMIKTVLFNKTKNTCVRFFIYMSSMHVQLFTAFELAVICVCTLVSTIKSKMFGRFPGNEPREKLFFSRIFHTDHN